MATAVDADGKATQRKLGSATELQSILKDVFASDIGNAESAALWARLEARAVEKAS